MKSIESFTDADCAGNKTHRRSTSCCLHFLDKGFAHGSARTQTVVGLSSCESELRAIVGGCCDGIYLKRCLEFLLQKEVKHVFYTDSSSVRRLISRQGSGKIRHLSGKILWVSRWLKIRWPRFARSQLCGTFLTLVQKHGQKHV